MKLKAKIASNITWIYTYDYYSSLVNFDKCRNVFLDHNSLIRVMPFDTKRNGMWYFDGQIFYQRPKGRIR